LYPKESAIRSYRLDTRHEYGMNELDRHCSNSGLQGGIDENLDAVLDAIIDKKWQ
jgi:hypothetical protein